ncbi:hypothetical protein MBLNU459_g6415t1 [Dothideomycetes sp. NU459]
MGMPTSMEVPVPLAARFATTTLEVTTIAVLVFCMTRRIQNIKSWRTLSVPALLLLAIYVDTLLFISVSTILSKSIDLNSNPGLCDAGTITCLSFYGSTKVLIYFFFVEKVHVVRNPCGEPRLKDKLYLFNMFGVMTLYVALIVLSFVFRLHRINEHGQCYSGIDRDVLIPLACFDVALNIYLTALFVQPLCKLQSLRNKATTNGTNQTLRRAGLRTTIGSCATLTSTVVNIGLTAGLNGEAYWMCLMICNLDVLWAAMVLHWMTSQDSQDSSIYPAPSQPAACAESTGRSEPDYDNILLNEVALKTPAAEKKNPFVAASGILFMREFSVEDVEEGKGDASSIKEAAREHFC